MACEVLANLVFTDLATDEAVSVLMGIEIVKCLLEGENVGGILAEHDDEGGIPHKQESVEGGVDIIGYETGGFVGRTQIGEGDLPGIVVAGDDVGVSGIDGLGQPCLDVLVSG